MPKKIKVEAGSSKSRDRVARFEGSLPILGGRGETGLEVVLRTNLSV